MWSFYGSQAVFIVFLDTFGYPNCFGCLSVPSWWLCDVPFISQCAFVLCLLLPFNLHFDFIVFFIFMSSCMSFNLVVFLLLRIFLLYTFWTSPFSAFDCTLSSMKHISNSSYILLLFWSITLIIPMSWDRKLVELNGDP